MAVARRMAARLLRAHRGGVMDLSAGDVDRCVDGCTRPFVPTAQRQSIQRLWLTHGKAILSSKVDREARSSDLDPYLLLVLEGSQR